MLAILNLSPVEIVIILVVAVVVFGRRLPEVAGQAAGAVQRMRRSLEDLRRETGIDREIQNARREIDEAVPRDVRPSHISRKAREGLDRALRSAEVGAEDVPPPVPPAKRDVADAAAEDDAQPAAGTPSPAPVAQPDPAAPPEAASPPGAATQSEPRRADPPQDRPAG
jgi:Sec-independent protein translocase protein TatA